MLGMPGSATVPHSPWRAPSNDSSVCHAWEESA